MSDEKPKPDLADADVTAEGQLMSLEQLIKTLEGAMEMTDGQEEWSHGDFDIHAGKWLRAKCQFRGEAQAIADRHNTAGLVLDELKRHMALQGSSAFWGRAAGEANNDRDEAQARAEKAEAKVMELGTEVARLNAGWHEDNGKALEIGLERTDLEKQVSEAKGLLSDCFDGIESDSLAAMIQSAGGAFALMGEVKHQSSSDIPADWSTTRDIVVLYEEDDARPPDREMLAGAWERLFSKVLKDETPLDKCDHGDAFATLYSGGRIAWSTCQGGRIERLKPTDRKQQS